MRSTRATTATKYCGDSVRRGPPELSFDFSDSDVHPLLCQCMTYHPFPSGNHFHRVIDSLRRGVEFPARCDERLLPSRTVTSSPAREVPSGRAIEGSRLDQARPLPSRTLVRHRRTTQHQREPNESDPPQNIKLQGVRQTAITIGSSSKGYLRRESSAQIDHIEESRSDR